MATLFSQSIGTGKDLVLLHGWGLNSGVWSSIAPLLQQHFRVTTIDLPGFGRNADVQVSPYSLEAVSAAVSAHVPEGASLLGWSLGGLVAQQIALKSPDKVAHLLLVASSPRFLADADWPGMQPVVMQTFEKQLERDFSKTLDRFLAIQAMGSPSAKEDIRRVRQHVQDFPMPDPAALQGGLSLLATADLRSEIGQLTMPTERIYGRLDSLVPHKVIEKVEALQPNARTHRFEHASHAPFISHAPAFCELLISLLQTTSAAK